MVLLKIILGGSEVGNFSPLGFFLSSQPAGICHLSPLLAEEGCRFPPIHALHAANMEPVRTTFGGSVDGG